MAIHLNCQQSPVEMISGWSQPQSRTPWLWSENGIVPTAQLSSSTGDYSRDHLSWRLLGAVGRGGGPTTNPRVPRPTASYQNHHHHHQNCHYFHHDFFITSPPWWWTASKPFHIFKKQVHLSPLPLPPSPPPPLQPLLLSRLMAFDDDELWLVWMRIKNLQLNHPSGALWSPWQQREGSLLRLS